MTTLSRNEGREAAVVAQFPQSESQIAANARIQRREKAARRVADMVTRHYFGALGKAQQSAEREMLEQIAAQALSMEGL